MPNSLPDELLFTIFQQLDSADLVNCQLVCRSWYHLAHTEFLEDVTLTSTRAIDQFLAALDLDNNQGYLKAVKVIQLSPKDGTDMALDRETIERLFFRLPNLVNVYLDKVNLISNFDEELCSTFLSRCPSLNLFHVKVDDVNDLSLRSVEKVHTLLTNISIPDDSSLNGQNLVEFVSRFPRLQIINLEDEEAGWDLGQILPIFEKLSKVECLYMTLIEDVEENFGEKYFSTKSEEIRNRVAKNLSKILALSIDATSNVGNVIQFVSEYFTGLKTLYVVYDFVDDGSLDAENDLFCRNMFSLIPSIKDHVRVISKHTPFRTLVGNFTSLIQNMFQNVPAACKQTKNRVLKLCLCTGTEKIFISLDSDQSPFPRELCIMANKDFFLDGLALDLLKSGAPICEVDVFMLNISCNLPTINASRYLQVLEATPSLTQVMLDVPKSYVETEQESRLSYSGPVLPQLEEATLSVAARGPIQLLLDMCYFAFPNLKRLDISHYAGAWNSSMGEFQLCLPNYSMEKLTFDTAPVIEKMNQLLLKTDPFFVLEVENQSLGERHLYKVSADASSCQRVYSADLKNLMRRKDYLCVRLAVNYLKQVELRWYDSTLRIILRRNVPRYVVNINLVDEQ